MIKSLLKPCCYECDHPEIKIDELTFCDNMTSYFSSVEKWCWIFCGRQKVCLKYNNTKLIEEEFECKM